MQVLFAGTQLCTAKGTSSPQDFSVEGQCGEQVAKFLRGAGVQVLNRGNEQTAVSFKLFRSHGSIQIAQTFALTHRATMPKYGVLKMVSDDGSGKQTVSVTLPNALFKKCKVSYKGMNTVAEYQFDGGLLSLPTTSLPRPT